MPEPTDTANTLTLETMDVNSKPLPGVPASLLGASSGGACRMTGPGVLRDRAKKQEREAAGLNALADQLESVGLSRDSDEALWELAIRR